MIYEYALDPALLDNWKDFRFFRDSFGVDQGRLISDYPRRWHRAVLNVIRQAECGDVEKQTMKAALRRIKPPILYHRRNATWVNEHDWLDNALNEHRERPFHAIVHSNTGDDPLEEECLLCGDEMDNSKESWVNESTAIVNRNAVDMAVPAKSLLGLAQHILFVDPHFDPNERRFNEPLIQFLNVIATRNAGIPVQRIEYHTSDKIEVNYFKQMVNQWIRPRMPAGLTLSFVQRPGAEMHSRHIVTNIGALTYENGLDTGSNPPQVRVYRDSRAGWEDLWQRYFQGTPFFTVST